MANEPFTWGAGGRRISATEAERNRKTAEALASRYPKPQNMWEGIASVTGDIGGALLNWQADEAQEAGRQEVADALEAAQAGEDPMAYLSVLGNEWAAPSQSAVANALLDRAWTAEDREKQWARDDALRSDDRAWNVSLLEKERGWTLEDREDERDYNQPVRDLQIEGAGLENEAGKITLDQLKEGYTPLVTPEQRAAFGIPETDKSVWYQGPDGKPYNEAPGGGTSITVNTGDGQDGALNKALSTKEGESWAAIKDAGMVAGGMGQDLGILDELIKIAPQGPIVGPLAETFKGFSSAGDAFQSIVKRVAPSLRTPGSGATSDIEYQGFLESLPSLKNSPEANTMINSIMKAKAAINKQRADIVTAYQAGDLSIEAARAEMGRLNGMSIVTPEMRNALVGIGSTGEVAAAPKVGEVVDGYVYQGGDPANPNSWKPQ